MNQKIVLRGLLLFIGVLLLSFFSFFKKSLQTELENILEKEFREVISFLYSENNTLIGVSKKNATFASFFSSKVPTLEAQPGIECFNLTPEALGFLDYVSENLRCLVKEVNKINLISIMNREYPYFEIYSSYMLKNATLEDFQKIEIWKLSENPYYMLTYWNNTTTIHFTVSLDEGVKNEILARLKFLEERCRNTAVYCNLTYYYRCWDIPLESF